MRVQPVVKSSSSLNNDLNTFCTQSLAHPLAMHPCSLSLDVGRCTQVVRMRVCLQDPIDGEAMRPRECNPRVGSGERNTATPAVAVKPVIHDCAARPAGSSNTMCAKVFVAGSRKD